MAFPQLQLADRSTLAEAVAGTAHTMAWPDHIRPDSLLIFHFLADPDGAGFGGFPAGFTQLTLSSALGFGTYLESYYIATGTESGTFAFTTAASCRVAAIADRIIGWNAIELRGSSQVVGSNPAVCSGCTGATWGVAEALWCASMGNSSVPASQAFPVPFPDGRVTVNTNRTLRAAYANNDTVNPYSSGTWTNAISANRRNLTAVQPGSRGLGAPDSRNTVTRLRPGGRRGPRWSTVS